jgi:hypothetical protein
MGNPLASTCQRTDGTQLKTSGLLSSAWSQRLLSVCIGGFVQVAVGQVVVGVCRGRVLA